MLPGLASAEFTYGKGKWWLNPDSNWGHADFQSAALPTELFSHPLSRDKGRIQRIAMAFDKSKSSNKAFFAIIMIFLGIFALL